MLMRTSSEESEPAKRWTVQHETDLEQINPPPLLPLPERLPHTRGEGNLSSAQLILLLFYQPDFPVIFFRTGMERYARKVLDGYLFGDGFHDRMGFAQFIEVFP